MGDLQARRQEWNQAEEEESGRFAELRASKPIDLAIASNVEITSALQLYRAERDRFQKAVESSETVCTEWAARATEIKTDAQSDLDECLPQLHACVAAVNGLRLVDLHEV